MKTIVIVLAVMAMGGPAVAQTTEQQQRGLGAAVMALIQENVALRTQIVVQQDEIAAMKAAERGKSEAAAPPKPAR